MRCVADVVESDRNPTQEWHPRHNPWLIAVAVMLSTFMEVLDSSIANVALPHIAGNLSASNHEATWVLTSYLVSNAVILPATAWFSGFFGRKRFLILCTVLFAVSSALCGLANSLGLLVFARVVQGAGGGALVPISQAVLLESFPVEKRGLAMAVFAMGVVVAPIIGPTIGGWITDNFSWRWIFFINLPLGMLSVWMVKRFVEDPPYLKRDKSSQIDYVGFLLMAVGLGVLQVVLDKGQEVDWFEAPWLCWATFLVILSLASFVFWELHTKDPVVNLRILKDKNFSTGMIIITVVGAILYGTTTLLPLFLQSLMGYSAYLAGLATSPRGIGCFLAAIIAGRLSGIIDEKWILAFGLTILGLTCYDLGNINLEIGMMNIVWPIIGTGIGISAVFVSLSTITLANLKKEEMGNGAGLFNLMRNIGGSIGIAMATTLIARMSQVHQAMLTARLTPFDSVFQAKVQALSQLMGASTAMGSIYQELIRQSALLAYIDNFRWFGISSLVCIPLVFLFRKVHISKDASIAMH